MIMDSVLPQILGVIGKDESIRRVNSIAQGAITGAFTIMEQRELLQSIVGDIAPVLALPVERREQSFIAAASAGMLVQVQALLHVTKVDCRNTNGRTPLLQAACGGHTTVLSALLQAGAETKAVDKDGFVALMLAAANGHADACSVLLGAGANAAAARGDGQTALMMAAQKDHPSVVSLLVERDANASATDNLGHTAAWYARHLGNERVVGLLPAIETNTALEDTSEDWAALFDIKYGRSTRGGVPDQHALSEDSSTAGGRGAGPSGLAHDAGDPQERVRPVEINYSRAEGSLSAAFLRGATYATAPAAEADDEKDDSSEEHSSEFSETGPFSLSDAPHGMDSLTTQLQEARKHIAALKAQLSEAGLEPVGST